MDYIDYPLDHYLDKLKEKNLNEFDPLSLGVAGFSAATLIVIGKVVSYLMSASTFRKAIKVDNELSKRVNNILKTGNKWVVHTFPDITPNAFAIGGNNVYITTGLRKLLNEREQDAVLLHEIFHNKDLHVWKGLAAESSFVYLVAFVAITSTIVIGNILALLIYLPLKYSMDIAYSRIAKRKQEIKADEYAVKYGYGDELISALNKMERWISQRVTRRYCGSFCQLRRTIDDAIAEHPSTKKRIEIILRKSRDLERAMSTKNLKKIRDFVVGVFKNNG